MSRVFLFAKVMVCVFRVAWSYFFLGNLFSYINRKFFFSKYLVKEEGRKIRKIRIIEEDILRYVVRGCCESYGRL